MHLNLIPRGALQIACAVALVYPAALAGDAPSSKGSARSFAGKKAGQVRDDNGLKLKLVWCPPGKFTMGSPKSEALRLDDEGPASVTLTKGFWLGQHEVTQSEWQRVMQTTPRNGRNYVKEGNDYPAT